MKISYKKPPGKLVASVLLVALLGTSAGLSLNTIAEFEGYVPEAYQDPIGIWTKCWGDTNDVIPGETYTFDQCVQSINVHTLEIAEPVFNCVPGLRYQADKVIAAAISMAYNIGSGAFCGSSVADYFRSGQWSAGCQRIAKIYRKAGGKELTGLIRRRQMESDMCMEGLKEVR